MLDTQLTTGAICAIVRAAFFRNYRNRFKMTYGGACTAFFAFCFITPDRVAGISSMDKVLVELFHELRGLHGNTGVRVTITDHPGAATGRDLEECLADVAKLPVVLDHIQCLLLTDLPGIVFFRETVHPEGAGAAPHEQT